MVNVIRYLSLWIFFICPSITYAQWDVKFNPKDEMKNVPAYYSNMYLDAKQNILFWFDSKDTYLFIAAQGKHIDMQNETTKALFGFYEDGKLQEKHTVLLHCSDTSPGLAMTSESLTKGIFSKTVFWLKKQGDVRIIIETTAGTDIDFTIPRNKELKTYTDSFMLD